MDSFLYLDCYYNMMADKIDDVSPNVKKKYNCNMCRFKFSYKQGSSMKLRCPNCGSENVSVDTFNLNTMIDEC